MVCSTPLDPMMAEFAPGRTLCFRIPYFKIRRAWRLSAFHAGGGLFLSGGGFNGSSRARSATPLIEFRGVGKRFGEVVAAEGLDLQVRAGEFLSFLGPSGCGKTTSLRMIAGFEQPSEGEVLIGGENMN